MTTVYLSLGSNIPPRETYLNGAVDALRRAGGVTVTAVSRLYTTQPWGGVAQEDFLNLALALMTELDPEALLDLCQSIERAGGRDRERGIRWGPRTLDIDILLYGGLTLQSERLVIPHPFLTERDFVLVPLLEIAPDLTLPDGRRLSSFLSAGHHCSAL